MPPGIHASVLAVQATGHDSSPYTVLVETSEAEMIGPDDAVSPSGDPSDARTGLVVWVAYATT